MVVVNAQRLGDVRHPESVAKLLQGHGHYCCTRAGSQRSLRLFRTLAAQRVACRVWKRETDKVPIHTDRVLLKQEQLASRTRSSQSASPPLGLPPEGQ